jgi:hypothetical protein
MGDASMTDQSATASYEATRERLMAEWREARRRRDSAPLGGDEFRAAAEDIARLEIEIASLDRERGRV